MVSPRWTWIRRRVNPIVIDFGHHAVRMLQMSNHGSRVQIIARDCRRMSAGPIARKDLSRLRAESVRDMLSERRFLGRKVISVLPWELLAIRNLRVPCMPENDLNDVVRYEACERFGFDPAKAEIRHLPVGEVRQGTDMRHEVIALGANSDELDGHLQMLDQLGLVTAGLDPGPCALFRSFERFLKRSEDRQKVCAIVDLGHSATRVLVSRGDHPVFFKEIVMGGASLDEEISRNLDVTLEEASRWRRHHGDESCAADTSEGPQCEEDSDLPISRDRMRACLEPVVDQLAREIGLCLRYCAVTFRGMQTPTVYLVGGGARDHMVRGLLEGHLAPSVEVGRCMREIEMDIENEPEGSDRRSGEPEWATAVGAGLKSLAGQEVLVS